MATANFTHAGEDGFPTDKRESHWLPALRPDAHAHEQQEEMISQELTQHKETEDTQILERSNTQSNVVSNGIALESSAATSHPNPDPQEHDDRLDPAWGIRRTDSAHILDGVQRSTSFPPPQLASTPASFPSHSTNPSESVADVWQNDADDDGLLEDEAESLKSETMGFDPSAIEGQQQMEVARMGEESSTERYDEGVPLLQSKEQSASAEISPAKTSTTIPFDAQATADEASFFSELNTQMQENDEPAHLDRKSTTDVLDSLGFISKEDQETSTDFFQQLSEDQSELLPPELSASQDQVAKDDKWAALLDDDEFLIEDADDLLPDSEPGSPSSFIASLQNDNINVPEMILSAQASPGAASHEHTPHQPSTSDMLLASSQGYGHTGFSQPGLPSASSFQSHAQQPPAPQRAESYADQSKGGYKSPYDLPMDISKPKKKAQAQRAVSLPQRGMPPPPPRTSSMSSDQQRRSSLNPNQPPADAPVQLSKGPGRDANSSSFFEELPIKSRQRPANPGRYTPVQNADVPPQGMPTSPPRHRVASGPVQPSPPQVSEPLVQYQLQPPERVDPYANVALQAPAAPSMPTNTRYSPALSSTHGPPKPTPSPRYSPAPPMNIPGGASRYVSQPVSTQAPASSNGLGARYVSQPSSTSASVSSPALPFQPRTSSPLASQHRPVATQPGSMPPPALPRSLSSSNAVTTGSPSAQAAPPRPVIPASSATFSPSITTGHPEFIPPQRSQTQSPGRQVAPKTGLVMPNGLGMDRPASAFGNLSPTKSAAKSIQFPTGQSNLRPAFEKMDFIVPDNETSHDPLERWKGAPIFRFGFGGTVVTSFPTRTPRYASGLSKPQMKAGVGEVKVQKADSVWKMSEKVTSFPGPLRGKSKKKDVLTWLTTTIGQLEAESPTFLGLAQTLPDPRKCHEEKIVLWKIVRVMVENDGQLQTPDALRAVNTILAPEIHAIDESTASQYKSDTDFNGIYGPAGASAKTDSVDALAVENLRKHLLKGDRKAAVWHAVDHRLWSHALLLASTLRNEADLWQQVVQEFVRKEVKTIGNNAESLSALYQVFGGNLEESIDQLVPPSARAGLQMVSKVDQAGPTKNALDGLDKWKETLTLILNNRTDKDYRALLTLARLLSDYGRIEAAHICLLFAKNVEFPSILGGLDDPQASIVLLGADQRVRPADVQLDEDAVLLTEVYEFATCTLSGTSAAVPLPYLASYKLQKAKDLADHGHKSEAQAYCDAVAAGLKSGSKLTPYYHTLLLGELDELSNRIKQIPVQGSSWMSKPSIEKVSGSIFSRFTNFVAGEDSDAASQGSGKDANAEVGPFANVTGSPNLSRSGSQTDLYGSYPSMTSAIPQTAAASRYAPNGLMSNRSSSELARGRPSLDSQRSPPTTSHGHEAKQSLYSPLSAQGQSPARGARAYQPLGTSPSQAFGTSPSFSNYQPTPPQSSWTPNATQQASNDSPHFGVYSPGPVPEPQSIYTPVTPQTNEGQPAFEGYTPSQPSPAQTTDEQPADNPHSYGYEPPADTGYVPYQPDPDSDNDTSTKKPKKTFMDDDDDNYSRQLNPAGSSSHVPSSSNDATADSTARRKANDEAADAAFKAAAEADAQRAKEATAQKRSSGWFGGWLGGGKKDADSLDAGGKSSADSKVYKAKLGENKMKLYYDKELKKWVNPDDPDSAKAKSATPPPPRMGGGTPAPPMGAGLPRSVSGGTPVLPPASSFSRSSTPSSVPLPDSGIASALSSNVNASLGLANGSSPGLYSPGLAASTPLPPSGGGTPAPPATSGAPPPPKPAGNANPIDDLLALPSGPRKGARGAKKAKGGRYVDVMAK